MHPSTRDSCDLRASFFFPPVAVFAFAIGSFLFIICPRNGKNKSSARAPPNRVLVFAPARPCEGHVWLMELLDLARIPPGSRRDLKVYRRSFSQEASSAQRKTQRGRSLEFRHVLLGVGKLPFARSPKCTGRRRTPIRDTWRLSRDTETSFARPLPPAERTARVVHACAGLCACVRRLARLQAGARVGEAMHTRRR